MKSIRNIILTLVLILMLAGCPGKKEDDKGDPVDSTSVMVQKTEFTQKEGLLFETRIGGPDIDSSVDLIITKDGGYIIAGYTHSWGKGKGDACLVKCSADGKIEWSSIHGGPEDDRAYSVIETADGGYIAAGKTESMGAGKRDIYILKINNQGKKEWEKTFGGADVDEAHSIIQMEDGGYFVAGTTYSKGAGNGDVYLLKLDVDGNLIWDKTYGGETKDTATYAERTTDGGFIISGSGGEKRDCYILKVDKNGDKEWEKLIGGEYFDLANGITRVSDGGYVFAGLTQPEEGSKVDIYVVKLSGKGDKMWERQVGGKDHSGAQHVIEASDGSIIVTGSTKNTEHGIDDAFLMKLSSAGDFIWEETFGGNDIAYGNCVVEKSPGVYTVTGYILSTQEPDKGNYSIYLFSYKKD